MVVTDTNALFRIPGVEDPALGDVAVGDHVALAGMWESEATFQASSCALSGKQESRASCVGASWMLD